MKLSLVYCVKLVYVESLEGLKDLLLGGNLSKESCTIGLLGKLKPLDVGEWTLECCFEQLQVSRSWLFTEQSRHTVVWPPTAFHFLNLCSTVSNWIDWAARVSVNVVFLPTSIHRRRGSWRLGEPIQSNCQIVSSWFHLKSYV